MVYCINSICFLFLLVASLFLMGVIRILNVEVCQGLFPLDIEYSSASFVILVYWP